MSHVLHRSLRNPPDLVVGAEGAYLQLADGQRVIDAAGGAAVSCIGHGNRRVIDAMTAQARRLDYVHSMFVTSEPAEELAEHLLANEPGGLTRAFFTLTGSDAMESSLKMARQYHVERGDHDRTHYISRRQSYHGNNFGTMAASGHPSRRKPYEAVLPLQFSKVSACYPYRGKHVDETDQEYVTRLAVELDEEFQRVGPEKVIAFVAETVVGSTAGCVTALPGYFRAVREICDRYGALLIYDEVMCGMGRTGTTHAWEQEGVAPDIQGIAKALGGGYVPIGAMLINKKVFEVLKAGTGSFVHGHTLQGHPVSCAAALEVQRIIAEEDLILNVRKMGERLWEGLHVALGQNPNVGEIRGRGLFQSIELIADPETREPFDPAFDLARKLQRSGLNNGIAVYPNAGIIDGYRGDHFMISPAFNIKEDQIDEIVHRSAKMVKEAVAS